MQKFRKKPVVIEAMQVPDPFDYDATCDVLTWIASNGGAAYAWDGDEENVITVVTLEGAMLAGLGDWIIRGVAGEFYPCKPDIFDATYELVDGE